MVGHIKLAQIFSLITVHEILGQLRTATPFSVALDISPYHAANRAILFFGGHRLRAAPQPGALPYSSAS